MASPSFPIVPGATFASRPYDNRLYGLERQELPSEEVTRNLSALVADSVAGYLEFTGTGKTNVSVIKPKDIPRQ